jgi:hypothetical protein
VSGTDEYDKRNWEFLKQIQKAAKRQRFFEAFKEKLADPERDWVLVTIRAVNGELKATEAGLLSDFIDAPWEMISMRHRLNQMRSILLGVPKGEDDPAVTACQAYDAMTLERRLQLYREQAISLG